jgi:REP element-mobilizing transposase RayT
MTTRFDPNRHHRRSIRLPGYDYRQAGAYFVTICTYRREMLFDDPVLRQVAEALWQRIPRHSMARHFPHAQLDAWVVMPNHLHGIIIITDDPRCRGEASPEAISSTNPVVHTGGGLEGEPVACRGEASPGTIGSRNPIALAGSSSVGESVAWDASPLRERPTGAQPGSLGVIVGNYKAVTARRINRLRGEPGLPVWQRNYYEHVVRDERALNAIRQYIADNPARWAWDTYNPSAAGPDTQAADLWRLLQER